MPSPKNLITLITFLTLTFLLSTLTIAHPTIPKSLLSTRSTYDTTAINMCYPTQLGSCQISTLQRKPNFPSDIYIYDGECNLVWWRNNVDANDLIIFDGLPSGKGSLKTAGEDPEDIIVQYPSGTRPKLEGCFHNNLLSLVVENNCHFSFPC